MKAVFLTSLTSSQDLVKDIISQIKPYGLDISGHFWIDDLQKMSWMGARNMLTDSNAGLWVILGGREDFEKTDIRYGLSLMALSASAKKSSPLAIIILQKGADAISTEDLPTPLKQAEICPLPDKGLGARLVARAHQAKSPLSGEYHIDILGNEQIGQWFEIRPAAGVWPGAIFGAAGGKIVFQAVGPAGRLPEKTVLNYPLQGMMLKRGDVEYSAWAVQNEINPETAYYAKVENHPSSILFGPYSTEQAADVYVITLS